MGSALRYQVQQLNRFDSVFIVYMQNVFVSHSKTTFSANGSNQYRFRKYYPNSTVRLMLSETRRKIDLCRLGLESTVHNPQESTRLLGNDLNTHCKFVKVNSTILIETKSKEKQKRLSPLLLHIRNNQQTFQLVKRPSFASKA